MPVVVWLAYLHLMLFVVGCAVGSFLNVCIYRMGTGRSVSWPGSTCGACLRPIPGRHNVPLFTYLLLGGRCAMCGARFSARYFLVELLTGVVFAGLFALEVGAERDGWHLLSAGMIPPGAVPLWLGHAFLASLLIVAVGRLFDTGAVPPVVVGAGALGGLVFSAAFPELLLSPAWLAPIDLLLVPALLRLRRGLDRSWGDVALIAGGFLGWQPVAAALVLAAPLRRPALFALLVPLSWLAWPLIALWSTPPVAAALLVAAAAAVGLIPKASPPPTPSAAPSTAAAADDTCTPAGGSTPP